jgi:hypothetical protein
MATRRAEDVIRPVERLVLTVDTPLDASLVSSVRLRPVPRPPSTNVVISKWIFRHKLTSYGLLDRYKARWVIWGFTQHASEWTTMRP